MAHGRYGLDYFVSTGLCDSLIDMTEKAAANVYTFLQLRPCTWVWLILMLLTLAILAVGQMGLGGGTVVFLLIISTLIKTQLVADHFMGLKQVRLRWRLIVSLYLLVVMSMIGLAYWLSLT